MELILIVSLVLLIFIFYNFCIFIAPSSILLNVFPLENYQAKHLSWTGYILADSAPQVEDKIKCIMKYATYIVPMILKNATTGLRVFHYSMKHIFKIYWFCIVLLHWCRYLIPRFPRGINEIKHKNR